MLTSDRWPPVSGPVISIFGFSLDRPPLFLLSVLKATPHFSSGAIRASTMRAKSTSGAHQPIPVDLRWRAFHVASNCGAGLLSADLTRNKPVRRRLWRIVGKIKYAINCSCVRGTRRVNSSPDRALSAFNIAGGGAIPRRFFFFFFRLFC
jgi:hypothetical protein